MSIDYRLDHIALLVRDLDETTKFLTEVLQVRAIANPMGGTEIRWFEFGNGQRFHIQAGDLSAPMLKSAPISPSRRPTSTPSSPISAPSLYPSPT